MKFKIDDLEIGAIYLIDYQDNIDVWRSYLGLGILQLTKGKNDLYFRILNKEKTAFNLDNNCIFGVENIVKKINLINLH